ncbi:hypothetical protein EJ05DRAFT_490399 [Pseudovirgaria hyperparasitica]|uniref:Uncharacterized protein n=1 Tax=Pseudovirgaria hyperparasitica TaxID=470096 RepID=A0A6A6VT82_9PEZI|nr:uncharacterized protein EJ05DRAFT_490399 [Pseudovirgaria hyperparasitica]KAF2753089.1 hypothetical protein EJ05DRAFT_490399 [Pseudovirgaria hyperparasitica]
MSNGSNDRPGPPSPSPNATDRRRSSFSTGALADLFTRPSNANHNGPQAYPGPITTAAVQAQSRRLSLTTLGLSGSQGQASPFNTIRDRKQSFSSASSASAVDESPFEEEDRSTPALATQTNQFARRLSFGARALRDRQNSGSASNANGRPSVDKSTLPPPTTKGRAEGYNFADSMRSRAERGSMSGRPHSPPGRMHERAKSVAIMEPPKEMPKASPKIPDAFQERILKGDFYMD